MAKKNKKALVRRQGNRTRITSMLSVGLALATSLALASQPGNAEAVLQGTVCSERVHDLTSNVHWYNDLKEAEAQAQQQGKLVFWMHILGKIDGAT
jgi:hypothetical protein